MSCPLNKEHLAQLKQFIEVVKNKPDILHQPELEFFKNYIESLGGTIPRVSVSEDTESSDIKTEESTMDEEEKVESEPESDLELDMEGCIEPDPIDENQFMGDPSKEPTEEDIEKADEKRREAIREFSEGNYEKALEIYTEAIKINPNCALLFAKRGQVYLKLNKPNACIKDCTRALELNPDSAAAYKFRGRAYRLIADWEKAARDLRQACNIDFDEQTDEWLREVTPNARKLEQHKLKQERKKAEKELKEKQERIRKAREANARAAAANAQQNANAEAGGPTGGAKVNDFFQFLKDPEIMASFNDPEVAAAFQDISQNPANVLKYQSNPKIASVIAKIASKFGGAGGMPAGGFPGAGMFPGAGAGAGGFTASAPTDDDVGLD